MPNVSFQAPTDYSVDQADLERRRQYALALQQQAMQPSETQMVGGWAIPNSPLEGLAKVFKAYAAKSELDKTSAKQKELGQKYQSDRAAALANALRIGQGTPASSENIVDETANGGEGAPATINAPAVPGSRQAMIAALAGSQFPDFQQAALQQSLAIQKPTVVPAGANVLGPDNKPLYSAPFKPDAAKKDEGTWGDPYQINGATVQKNSVTGQVRQAVAREPSIHVTNPPAVTAVTIQDPADANGTLIIDGRTRQVLGKGPKLTQTGTAQQKLDLAAPQDQAALKETTSNLDRLAAAANEVMNHPGLAGITGLRGALPNIPGSQAANAQALLDTLRSQTGFSVLQNMRNNSKTGGALGQVSDVEEKLLQDNLAALSKSQDIASYKKNLKKIIDYTNDAKTRMSAAVTAKHAALNAGASPQSGVIDFSALPK